MKVPQIVRYLERNYSPKVPQRIHGVVTVPGTSSLPDDSTVIVVGGGIAGSAFTRQLLWQSQQAGKKVKVVMINSTNCNYCGGLVTNLAAETLESLYQLDIPSNLILKRIDQCVYINGAGSAVVDLHSPMTALLRTSRFGIEGFDDSIKDRILEGLEEPWLNSLVDIEPTIVTRIEPLTGAAKRWRVVLSKRNPDHTPIELEGDMLVVAGGLRALNRPMMQEFQQKTGFIPPPTIPASVTEIDTSKAVYNGILNRMVIVDNIIPGAVIAFIPKGEDWLTMTCLGKRLKKEELDIVFGHPAVKRFIDLPRASETPRCHTICGASIFTGPARNFYGDGWLVIGDLTGYGRVLKDGYFAAFLGAYLAANTIVYRGATREAFARYYHHPLKSFELDNRFGMGLFTANSYLQRRLWFANLLIQAARNEKIRHRYGGWLHGAIRALASGELTYRLILLLFITGCWGFFLLHPLKALRALRPVRTTPEAREHQHDTD
ncbi:hypothetical protein SY88_03040 [Clostridiales bacterium PH28_bin88]|nr:hypothetical protein SY88_03040 [Clostridiales bacterium PH28_bin88]